MIIMYGIERVAQMNVSKMIIMIRIGNLLVVSCDHTLSEVRSLTGYFSAIIYDHSDILGSNSFIIGPIFKLFLFNFQEAKLYLTVAGNLDPNNRDISELYCTYYMYLIFDIWSKYCSNSVSSNSWKTYLMLKDLHYDVLILFGAKVYL